MDALINVAVPVFAIVALGYLAGRFGVLGSDSAVALNRFVYYFALPPVLFVFTARAPFDDILNWPFIGAFVLGMLGTLALALVVGRFWFRHDMATLTMHGASAVFPNTGYMGIPLFLTAYGAEGALPAVVVTLAGNVVLIAGAITALEATRAAGASAGRVGTQVLGELARNPLLVAPVLGILFSAFAIPLPLPLGNLLDLLAAAGPAALFAIGLSLIGRPLTAHLNESGWLVMLKLVVQPALTFLLVSYVFTMDPHWAQSAVILAGLPTGALVFVIAQQYESYIERSSAVILLSTIASIATVSGLLILFGVG